MDEVKNTYMDRLHVEFNELNEKIVKLTKALADGLVPQKSISILEIQLNIMQRYLAVLASRIDDKPFKMMTFGEAVEAMKDGHAVARKHWNWNISKNRERDIPMFVFKQIPADIGEDVIPKMQSVPQNVKDLIMSNKRQLHYENQFAMVNADGSMRNFVDSWNPSASAILAEDWYIVK